MMARRPLGDTGLEVSPVALGCWPVSGMTSPDVKQDDSLATIAACFEAGINFLDTAYAYGQQGESERLIARALGPRRDEMVIATKVGLHWEGDRQRVFDASPARVQRELDESLRRLETDRVELLYLHAPDPQVPIAETAGALRRLLEAGKARAIGVSNLTIDQMEAFRAECPLVACQPPYNMLQRDIEADLLPWCREHDVAVMVYWPLMKGLLAGKLRRDHVFPEGDSRRKYPMFNGEQWQRNMDFVDQLREIANEIGKPVAELVINWTIHQPGITAALCGAKRPAQIRETAAAMQWELSSETRARIEQAIRQRGPVDTRSAV